MLHRVPESFCLLLLTTTILVSTGCRLSEAPDPTDLAESAPAAAANGDRIPSPAGSRQGEQAPALDLPLLGTEGRLSLADQRGKVVLLSFWASWCGPCRVEIPALDKAWEQYRDKEVLFLGVSLDDHPAEAEAFLRSLPVSYPMVMDAGGVQTTDPWWVASLPTTVIIDKTGVIRGRHLGYTPRLLQEGLNLIDDLLEEPSP
ncbi:MAG: TlpA disulfide reductase family protein, partial [Myxococcota bacterium]|nr:TlpA disulfide reductase family protein [Myxococcota bacterium]